MPADPLIALDTLIRKGLPPEDLTLQAALLVSDAVQADWAGLYAGDSDAHTYLVVHHHPDLPTPLLAYLDQRTRSVTPLARAALASTQPTFVDNYPEHPDAQQGAVLLGVSAVAHLPFGHQAGQSHVTTVMRVATSHKPARGTPWTEAERAFMVTAAGIVRAALTRTADETW